MTARTWTSVDPESCDRRRRALTELDRMIPPEVRRDIAIQRAREADLRASELAGEWESA